MATLPQASAPTRSAQPKNLTRCSPTRTPTPTPTQHADFERRRRKHQFFITLRSLYRIIAGAAVDDILSEDPASNPRGKTLVATQTSRLDCAVVRSVEKESIRSSPTSSAGSHRCAVPLNRVSQQVCERLHSNQGGIACRDQQRGVRGGHQDDRDLVNRSFARVRFARSTSYRQPIWMRPVHDTSDVTSRMRHAGGRGPSLEGAQRPCRRRPRARPALSSRAPDWCIRLALQKPTRSAPVLTRPSRRPASVREAKQQRRSEATRC